MALGLRLDGVVRDAGGVRMQDLSGFLGFGGTLSGVPVVREDVHSTGWRSGVSDGLDVSNLLDADGRLICWSDVTVSDDGAGRRVLTFALGESIVLPCPVAPEGGAGQGFAGFVAGTAILTERGEVPVERILVGDRVVTLDHGLRPVVWAGARVLEREALEAAPQLMPVAIRAGAAGNRGEVLVAPGQAILVPDSGRLVAARDLAAGDAGARVARGKRRVAYHQLLLDRHGIVFAQGMAAATLYPARGAVGPEIVAALPVLGPVLAGLVEAEAVYGPPARPFGPARRKEAGGSRTAA